MATQINTTGAIPHVTQQFDKSVNDALVGVGERFGLYTVLASIGPSTTQEVADCTGIGVPQIGHWLREQAAAGYVDYDRSSGRFALWCDITRN